MKTEYKGISVKVLTPIIVVIVAMVFSSLYFLTSINKLKSEVDGLQNKSIVEMNLINEVRYNILHTAEILTDASATHEEAGFEEAAEFSENVHNMIDEIKVLDSDRVDVWEDILDQYEGFYDLCCQMATAYINEGLEAGNELMEQVDPVTEQLSELVDSTTEDIDKDVEDTVASISGKIFRMGTLQVCTSVLYLFLMIYLWYTIMIGMVKPITRVSSSLQVLADKDLTVGSIESNRKDEIGGLIFAFNSLRESLREIMGRMDDSTRALENMSSTMSERSETIKENVSDITKAVSNVSSLAATQASDIEDSMKEIMALQDIAKQNQSVSDNLSDASKQIYDASEQGTKILGDLYQSSKDSEVAFSEIFNSIEKIKESTYKISEASGLIDNIAGQTNLLSLNASIEAARAGDAGRGFAVVADEIRSLSDESARSVEEINRMIQELISNVDIATKQSSKVREAVDKQMEGVENTRESYQNISDNLVVINKEIKLLGEMSGNITSGCNAVNDAMQSLSAAAEENAANSEETTASVEEVLALTEEIADGTVEVKRQSDEMSGLINDYRM